MDKQVITYEDYIKCFNAINAQGKGIHFLALTKLDDVVETLDGSKATHELLYRELSKNCEHARDEAYVNCRFSELSYYTEAEVNDMDTDNLFDCFNLF